MTNNFYSLFILIIYIHFLILFGTYLIWTYISRRHSVRADPRMIQITDRNLILAFFFTLLPVTLVIWLRLIRHRLPRDLLNDPIGIDIYLMGYLGVIFSFYSFYYFLHYFEILPRKNGKIIKMFNDAYVYLVNRFPKTIRLYEYLEDYYLHGSRYFIEFYLKYNKAPGFIPVADLFISLRPYHKYIYIAVFILIPLGTAITLFIEILIYKRIDYFYKLVPLLLIPSFFRALFLILYLNSTSYIAGMDYLFEIIYVPNVLRIESMTRKPIEDKTKIMHYPQCNLAEDLAYQKYIMENPEEWATVQCSILFNQQIYNIYLDYEILLIKKNKYLVNGIRYMLLGLSFTAYVIIKINV
jgi:hypothetical protein